MINERIRFDKLRVITETGENLGELSTAEALKQARERERDLVVISEGTNPPVAKILDFNKFLYETRKKQSASKAKSKKSELKELRIGPVTDGGDLAVRVGRAKEFLAQGHKVKFTLKLKGRTQAHPELGFEKINRVIKELEGTAVTEDIVKKMGNIITVTFVAK